MKKLLGIRTVYDIDHNKTFRIADVLESGAILPHSVPLSEVMVSDLQDENPICVCLEYIGDNGYCPVHGQPLGELDGSDTSMKAQLNDSGFGCSSAWWNSIEEIPF